MYEEFWEGVDDMEMIRTSYVMQESYYSHKVPDNACNVLPDLKLNLHLHLLIDAIHCGYGTPSQQLATRRCRTKLHIIFLIPWVSRSEMKCLIPRSDLRDFLAATTLAPSYDDMRDFQQRVPEPRNRSWKRIDLHLKGLIVKWWFLTDDRWRYAWWCSTWCTLIMPCSAEVQQGLDEETHEQVCTPTREKRMQADKSGEIKSFVTMFSDIARRIIKILHKRRMRYVNFTSGLFPYTPHQQHISNGFTCTSTSSLTSFMQTSYLRAAKIASRCSATSRSHLVVRAAYQRCSFLSPPHLGTQTSMARATASALIG